LLAKVSAISVEINPVLNRVLILLSID
jgi:hypothetical protein